MKANELIRRYSRAASLAAEIACVHDIEGATAEDLLVVLESLLRDRLLVAARHGCPHDARHVAWDQPTREWRCVCGQAMNLDGSAK